MHGMLLVVASGFHTHTSVIFIPTRGTAPRAWLTGAFAVCSADRILPGYLVDVCDGTISFPLHYVLFVDWARIDRISSCSNPFFGERSAELAPGTFASPLSFPFLFFSFRWSTFFDSLVGVSGRALRRR